MNEMQSTAKRAPHMWEAVLALVILVSVMSFSLIKLGTEPHIPFIIVIALTAPLALRMGYSWNDLEGSIIKSLSSVLQAVIILIMVGLVIGGWIQGGVVPSLIYYGLELINPKYFIVAIFLVCCCCSLATGTSWTIVGTLGVAAMGISGGLGIPLPVTAGTVVCAAYLGDKMSPLSDSPNLHCAIVKVNIFDHIKALLWTTIPSFILSLIYVAVVGYYFSPSGDADMSSVSAILASLDQAFVISPLLLLPVLMVFVIVILKVPAIPSILFMALTGSLCAILIQGASLADAVTCLHSGYVSATGDKTVDELLTRGGMTSMMGTVALIFCAIAYGGILEGCGILKLLIETLLKYIRTTGSLITSTVLSCIVLNIVAIDNYVAAVIAGSMFRKAYIKRGLSPLNLSRCLGEGASITSPLIPWNTCGIVMFGFLGVSPVEYAPYAPLCFIPAVITMLWGYLNIGILRISKEEAIKLEPDLANDKEFLDQFADSGAPDGAKPILPHGLTAEGQIG